MYLFVFFSCCVFFTFTVILLRLLLVDCHKYKICGKVEACSAFLQRCHLDSWSPDQILVWRTKEKKHNNTNTFCRVAKSFAGQLPNELMGTWRAGAEPESSSFKWSQEKLWWPLLPCRNTLPGHNVKQALLSHNEAAAVQECRVLTETRWPPPAGLDHTESRR